jgi:hypothetical protein
MSSKPLEDKYPSSSDYDLDLFVSPCFGMDPQHLLCAICLSILRKPVNTKCGHLFCRGCLKSYQAVKQTIKCPSCRDPIDLVKHKLNFYVTMLVQKQMVKCRYWNSGCNAEFVIGSNECNLIHHKRHQCEFLHGFLPLLNINTTSEIPV